MKILLICAAMLAAWQTEPLAFEAASIKRSAAGPGSSGVNTTPGRLTGKNVTLRRCIRSAYGVSDIQIIGGPKWIDDERFDIVATAHDAGDKQLDMLFQGLLTERFKLAVHRETRMLSGYALTLAKGGLKAKPSVPDTPAHTETGRGRIEAQSCTLPYLALRLSTLLGVPVQDTTAIPGAFDISLEWQPDELQTSLFGAIQTQLGLRLESRKLPVEVIVIDHAEMPSAN